MKVDSTKQHFYTIGISYKTADLNTRGQFSLSNEQCVSLLKESKEKGIKEILINTCKGFKEVHKHF